jgi:hypothetical protein
MNNHQSAFIAVLGGMLGYQLFGQFVSKLTQFHHGNQCCKI